MPFISIHVQATREVITFSWCHWHPTKVCLRIASIHQVISKATSKHILIDCRSCISGTTLKDVIAFAAFDFVISVASIKIVVALSSYDVVCSRSSDDCVVA